MIDIKDISGNIRLSVPVSEKAVYKKELMKEEYILLAFSSNMLISFSKGDYIETEFGRFELVYLESPEELSNGYSYNLKFHTVAEKFKNRLFFYDRQGRKEKTWSLTGTIAQFGSLAISNLKIFGDYTISIDSALTASKVISFDSTSIFDALTAIAQAFDTEWWITDNVIHFSKCEFGTEVILEKDILITSMTAQSGEKEKAITRLYPFGSTRNIPNDYRCKQAITQDVVYDEVTLVDGSVTEAFHTGKEYLIGYIGYVSDTGYKISKTIIEFTTGQLIGKKFIIQIGNIYGDSSYKAGQMILLGIGGASTNNAERLIRIGDKFTLTNFTANMPLSYITKKVIQEADTEYNDSNLVVGGVIEKRLMLPRSKGDHIDAYPNLADEDVVEGVVAFEDVYPRRVGTITEVFVSPDAIYDIVKNGETETKIPWYPFQFIDNEIDFKSLYIQEGKELNIRFESGLLQGFNFKASYIGDTERFEIVRNDQKIPNDVLKPSSGDKYILENINISLISDVYIPTAEVELFNVASEWLQKNSIDTSVYSCKTNPILCSGYSNGSHVISEEVDLQVGQSVKLINPTYFKDGRSSRIYGFEKKLDNKFECSYLVGETAAYSRLNNLENKIDEIQYKGGAYENVFSGSGSSVYLIKEFDDTPATDFNTLSAKKLMKSFLRKDIKDVAEEVIIFLKGLVSKGLISAEQGINIGDFIKGDSGANIDENGNSQFESIESRTYLKVMELIYNRLSAMEGDYTFTDFGTIDIVEDLGENTYRLTMRKRWNTDFTSLHDNDVIYGIVNSLANNTGTDVYTSWLRVLNVNTTDNTITAVMYNDADAPAGKNFSPTVSMNITRRGNSDSPTDGTHNGRQDSWLLSSTDGRILFLENVFKPILEQYNYALSIGKLPELDIFKGLPVSKDDMCVYSKNVIAQNYFKVDANGVVSTNEVFRGEWSANVASGASPYRRLVNNVTTGTGTIVNVLELHTVYHLGCKWACLTDKTVAEPKWNSPDWQFLQGDNRYSIVFDSDKGWSFFYGAVNATVIARVLFGNTDITDEVMALVATTVQWTRSSGNIPDDNTWVPVYGETKNVVKFIQEDMGSRWLETQQTTFTCKIFIPIGENTLPLESSISFNL